MKHILGTALAVVVILFAMTVLVEACTGVDIVELGRAMMTDGWSLAGAVGF